MTGSIYHQIVALRKDTDASRRGYRFEQALREILPWSARPPIAVSGESEQLDAFFEWNSWHFVVEAKAKKDPITRGSADWEDFDLKVRRRQGACIGLFCSLNSVKPAVVDAARELNRSGHCVLILADTAWDELEASPLPFDTVLRHMVWSARAQFEALPKSINAIRTWAYDFEQTKSQLLLRCRDTSAVFLRRHRHPKHDAIYVKRDLDLAIGSFADALKPSRLALRQKARTAHNVTFVQDRGVPTQLCIIRDTSGAGKTTLATSIALMADEYIGFGRAALEPDVDDLSRILRTRTVSDLLQAIIAIDRPLIYAVDSLDEAKESPQKKREVAALLRLISEWNEIATAAGLLAFPFGVVFTIRDDYWREWESAFEGSGAKVITNKFSTFSESEFENALSKYSSAFNFILSAPLTVEGRLMLSTPFNLQVFAEAFEYGGPTSPLDFLDRHVLSLYFDKRTDNIVRRQIHGLSASGLMRLAGALAMKCVLERSNAVAKPQLIEVISEANPLLAPVADQILLALRSDHILRQDTISQNALGFRHIKFVEYLVAYYVVERLSVTGDFKLLETHTVQIFESGLVSMFKVHEYVRHITATYFPTIREPIEEFYASSSRFMAPFVRQLRSAVAHGARTSADDLDLLVKNLGDADPHLAWEAFFVLAAKNNEQDAQVIANAFELTWSLNAERADRWKVVEKMARHGLLLDNTVALRIFESQNPKEWEVLLGASLRRGLLKEFKSAWTRLAPKDKFDELGQAGPDWSTTVHLLECLLNGKTFIPGAKL